ncbi:hypothetical protein NMY22_g8326 [Coprinellus aureogranulatus]|nr:hypothetical protein NMY22_g8326 [Coprinellus aureogranulatus]
MAFCRRILGASLPPPSPPPPSPDIGSDIDEEECSLSDMNDINTPSSRVPVCDSPLEDIDDADIEHDIMATWRNLEEEIMRLRRDIEAFQHQTGGVPLPPIEEEECPNTLSSPNFHSHTVPSLLYGPALPNRLPSTSSVSQVMQAATVSTAAGTGKQTPPSAVGTTQTLRRSERLRRAARRLTSFNVRKFNEAKSRCFEPYAYAPCEVKIQKVRKIDKRRAKYAALVDTPALPRPYQNPHETTQESEHEQAQLTSGELTAVIRTIIGAYKVLENEVRRGQEELDVEFREVRQEMASIRRDIELQRARQNIGQLAPAVMNFVPNDFNQGVEDQVRAASPPGYGDHIAQTHAAGSDESAEPVTRPRRSARLWKAARRLTRRNVEKLDSMTKKRR